MPKLLISVRSVQEARLAVAAGADLIDVKEPREGPLGAAASNVADDIVRHVNRRCLTSVACGELTGSAIDIVKQHAIRQRSLSRTGSVYADFVKTGLGGCGSLANWRERWKEFLTLIPAGTAPVAVIYADWRKADAPMPDEVIEHARLTSCPVVLIDTFDKEGAGLLSLHSMKTIGAWINKIHGQHMEVAVAGRLSFEDACEVAALGPDYIAARGAVCRPDRTGRLSRQLVSQWSRMLATRRRLPFGSAADASCRLSQIPLKR